MAEIRRKLWHFHQRLLNRNRDINEIQRQILHFQRMLNSEREINEQERESFKELLHTNPELFKALDSQQQSLLHLASANGHIEIVRVLKAARPEMCLARDRDGANPLHVAAMRGKLDVLEELLQANPHAARARVENIERETILHLCVKYNQLDCLQILLGKYFIGDEFVNTKDNAGNTILHLAVENRRDETYDLASAKRHIEIVRVLTAARPEMCLARDRDGANPLHVAAMRGNAEVLEQLLQANPHAARARVNNSERDTILHLCVKYNQPDCLEILLGKYFRGDEFVNAKDNAGNTILHLAVADQRDETYDLASAKRHIEIVRVLTAARPEMCLACDRDGVNPLHVAAMRGKAEVLEQLLQANPHAARARVDNSERDTILHLCVKYNQPDCLEILLGKYFKGDEFVNTKDNAGNTILHLAVADRRDETYDLALAKRHIEIVRVLTAARPKMCLARNRDGANPLHVAAMRGNAEVLEQLLQANPHAARARVNNSERDTILHLCVKYNQPDCLEILLGKYFKGDEFVNTKDNAGNTILHLAVADQRDETYDLALAKRHIEIVSVLTTARPEMCLARNRDSANPLHIAAMRGKAVVLEQLLQANLYAARARVDNSERDTILHLCVKYNQLDCLQILLGKYFKGDEFVNANDNAGNTILHLAVADRRYEIVQYVLPLPKIDVNAVNASKQTAMDILLAGKKKGTRLEGLDRDIQDLLEISDAKTARGLFEIWDATTARQADILDRKEIAEKRGAILLSAALMATLGFQVGVAPPGGVWQDDKDGHQSGKAVMASNYPILYSFFLCYNILGFISSLVTLVLMITDMPFRPGRYSRWMFITMSITVTSIAIAYSISLVAVSPLLRREPMTKTALAPAASVILLLLLIATIAGNIRRINRAMERAGERTVDCCC